MTKNMELNKLREGQSAVVRYISDENPLKSRIESVGITEGSVITPLFCSPFGDPTAYEVKGGIIALRKTDCVGITVTVSDYE